jgi:WD40 repeat protein
MCSIFAGWQTHCYQWGRLLCAHLGYGYWQRTPQLGTRKRAGWHHLVARWKIIASGSEAGDAYFWDASDYSLMGKINAGSTINSLQFTQYDTRLAVAGNIQTPDPKTGKTHYDGFAKLIDVKKREVIREYKGSTASVKSVRISSDEKWLATGSFDSTARVFDFESGKLLKTFKEPLRVEAIAFTADAQYLVTGGHQLKIIFYRLSDYSLAYELPCPRTEYIDFSDDGSLLLTAHEDSGMLSLYMMVSDYQQRPDYHKVADEQLNNRDLKKP